MISLPVSGVARAAYRSRLAEHLAEGANRLHVLLWRLEAGAHGVDSEMRGTEGAPGLDATAPLVLLQAGDADPRIDPEARTIAPLRGQVGRELIQVPLHAIVGRPSRRHPAVAHPRRALQHGLGGATEPNGNGAPHGQRIDPRVVDHVFRALVGDQRLGPELAQHLDLLLDASPARVEVLTERVVLHIVPADADAQT